jgi:uncharacterized protein YkwD
MPNAQYRPLGRALAVLISLLLFFGVSTVPASAVNGREMKLYHKINNARSNRGIAKLKLGARISKKAHKHSVNMAQKGELFHSCLPCKFQGWNWHYLAENVAKAETVKQAHKMLMNSPAHRDNILGTQFKKVGVGVVKARGKLWVTEIFYG